MITVGLKRHLRVWLYPCLPHHHNQGTGRVTACSSLYQLSLFCNGPSWDHRRQHVTTSSTSRSFCQVIFYQNNTQSLLHAPCQVHCITQHLHVLSRLAKSGLKPICFGFLPWSGADLLEGTMGNLVPLSNSCPGFSPSHVRT